MKVKTLIKRLSKYDPEMNIAVMVDGEVKTKKSEVSEHDYMFAYKLKVVKDFTMYSPRDKMCIVFGELEEIDHG